MSTFVHWADKASIDLDRVSDFHAADMQINFIIDGDMACWTFQDHETCKKVFDELRDRFSYALEL